MSQSNNSPHSILVVDDEPHLVRAVRMYLEFHGFAVFSARSGEEALEAIRDRLPDLVNKLHLNRGELPVPQGSTNAIDPWDRNGDGVFSAGWFLMHFDCGRNRDRIVRAASDAGPKLAARGLGISCL